MSGMLNKRPIFLVAFAYGGSNIVLNLLRSHPDVCSPRGEMNEVFKGKLDESIPTRIMKNVRYAPIVALEGYDVFGFNRWQPRKPFKKLTQKLIDRILFDEKMRARSFNQNYYKSENVRYTTDEIRESRLLCKNLDGLSYLTPELSRMYPDAVFFGLVRNGFAVCEGHMRRGHGIETIARHYEEGAQLMAGHSKSIPNYHLLRYEDIITNPHATLQNIYAAADLDPDKVEKIRLEAKKVIEKDGSHQVANSDEWKQLLWYPKEEFHKHFRPDTNENQMKRLTKEQKDIILKYCAPSLERFGYLDTASNQKPAPVFSA